MGRAFIINSIRFILLIASQVFLLKNSCVYMFDEYILGLSEKVF
jgi:hypothetical protein